MVIRLDHHSEQARDDRRQVLDLVAASLGSKDVYISELQRCLTDAFASQSPPERAAYLLDAAVRVTRETLRAWSAVLGASEQEVMHVL